MKKLIFTVALFTLFVTVTAQKDTVLLKNELAIVISDFIDAGMHLRFEKKLINHFSVSLGAAHKGKDGMINISGLNTPSIKTSNIAYSGIKVLTELRYYLKKTQRYTMDGFYTGLYSKSSFYKSGITGTFTDEFNEEEYLISIDTKIRIQSFGCLVGYKLALNKRFTLDFLFAGPGVAYFYFDLKPGITLPDQFYSDLNSSLKHFSYFDTTNPDFNFNPVRMKSKVKTLSFRYNISLGFSF